MTIQQKGVRRRQEEKEEAVENKEKADKATFLHLLSPGGASESERERERTRLLLVRPAIFIRNRYLDLRRRRRRLPPLFAAPFSPSALNEWTLAKLTRKKQKPWTVPLISDASLVMRPFFFLFNTRYSLTARSSLTRGPPAEAASANTHEYRCVWSCNNMYIGELHAMCIISSPSCQLLHLNSAV